MHNPLSFGILKVKHLLWSSLLCSGCLLGFEPFNEGIFLTQYEETLCPILTDCNDGEADQSSDSEYTPQILAGCRSYAREPQIQNCTIQTDEALICYDEIQQIEADVYAAQDCMLLKDWSEEAGKGCNRTYLNCVTDKPFGTLPIGGSAWND